MVRMTSLLWWLGEGEGEGEGEGDDAMGHGFTDASLTPSCL